MNVKVTTLDSLWTKVQRRTASAGYWWSSVLSQEDKPQSHQTVREISREAEGSIDHLFCRLLTKFNCYKKRRT